MTSTNVKQAEAAKKALEEKNAVVLTSKTVTPEQNPTAQNSENKDTPSLTPAPNSQTNKNNKDSNNNPDHPKSHGIFETGMRMLADASSGMTNKMGEAVEKSPIAKTVVDAAKFVATPLTAPLQYVGSKLLEANETRKELSTQAGDARGQLGENIKETGGAELQKAADSVINAGKSATNACQEIITGRKQDTFTPAEKPSEDVVVSPMHNNTPQ